jgi:hypothetical protein
MPTERLVLTSPNIIFEDFDGDLVVLNMNSGQYFGFNAGAAVVWEAFIAGYAPDALASAYSQPETVTSFAQQLVGLELLKAEGAAETTVPEKTRLLIAEMTEAPTVQVYDDLSDLILADPIHDVDQDAGWPHLPTP